MGAAKDMWMDEVQQVGEDVAFGRLTREEGIARLRRMGLDPSEADDMINEAIS